jgi:hypothetical protein
MAVDERMNELIKETRKQGSSHKSKESGIESWYGSSEDCDRFHEDCIMI